MTQKMDDRRKSNGKSTRYAELVKQMRTMCEQAKEDWLNRDCKELERLHSTDTEKLHQKLKELYGKKTSPPSRLHTVKG